MDVVVVFEVHQPFRLARDAHRRLLERALAGSLSWQDLEEALFDHGLNKLVMERAAKKCYVPATKIIIENLKKFEKSERQFKVAYSISGVFLEQARKWAPEVLSLLQEAASTGMVELVEQTYYHSMAAFLGIPDYAELKEQVLEHKRAMKELFGAEPVTIENTEFTYNNDLASLFYSMGYRVSLTEGADMVLGWRSPNYVYRAKGSELRVLTRNYRLSDDVGFRFSDRTWDQYPLTADKYAAWLSATPGDVVLLAMDYETFGEHHWPESGIHEFLRWLPVEVLKRPNLRFATPSEAAFAHPPRDELDVPPWSTISWADERDLSAWMGNQLQQSSMKALYDLYFYVKALGDPEALRLWRYLTISDHVYYQATKFGSVGEVHKYFSPYKNAAEAHAVFMEAVAALAAAVAGRIAERRSEFLRRFRAPPEKSFHFFRPDGSYAGFSASSLLEFAGALERLPDDVFAYHMARGDFSRWVAQVFAMPELAAEIEEARQLPLPEAKRRVREAVARALGG